MEYQPERYFKDGKLDPTVMDPASVAFGFGRRSVDSTSFATILTVSVYLMENFPLVLVLEDTSATIHYI